MHTTSNSSPTSMATAGTAVSPPPGGAPGPSVPEHRAGGGAGLRGGRGRLASTRGRGHAVSARRRGRLVSAPRRFLWFLVPLLISALPGSDHAVAQVNQRSGILDTYPGIGDQRSRGSVIARGRIEQEWSLETSLDPSIYRIVSGDQLSLGIWGETAVEYPIQISPLGEMVVPKVGPFRVVGMPLAEAELLAQRELKRFFPRSDITLRLLVPGTFRVSVTGMVEIPGTYEVTGADRVAEVITAAGGILEGGSLRHVRIVHPDRAASSAPSAAEQLAARNGAVEGSTTETRTTDLLLWFAAGEAEENPYLEPGWIVQVPPRRESIRIRGPVNGRSIFRAETEEASGNRPEEAPEIVVEWREGDRVGDALGYAGGLLPHAGTAARLYRSNGEILEIDLDSPVDLDRVLFPGDRLEIPHTDRWVFVTGACRLPGRYPYYPGYHPFDYLALAGGPSEIGRSDWTLLDSEGGSMDLPESGTLPPGTVVHVPERRSHQVGRWLAPLASAAALAISLVALLDNN